MDKLQALDKREALAGMALQALIDLRPGPSAEEQVDLAVRYADLLLERLNGRPVRQ